MNSTPQITSGLGITLHPAHSPRWLLPVALPIVAVVIGHIVIEPGSWTEVVRTLVVGTLWGSILILGLILVVLAILVITVIRGHRLAASIGETWIAVAVVGYFILLTSVSGRVAPLPIFDSLEYHWQGKVLDLLWVAILFGIFFRWAKAESGLRWRIEPGSARPALILIIGVFGLFVALTILAVATEGTPVEAISVERFAYNSTIPNLTEELIWRGAMLAVLARVFVASRTVFGAQVGWGVVISALIFGLGHAVLVDLSGGWSFSLAGGIFAIVMGLLFGWIWARTGSIWPAFVLHCAPELGLDVGMVLMG